MIVAKTCFRLFTTAKKKSLKIRAKKIDRK